MLFDRILDKFKWLKKEPDVISEENISEQKDEFEISFEELSKEIKLDAKLAAELSVNFSDFSNERLVSEAKTALIYTMKSFVLRDFWRRRINFADF